MINPPAHETRSDEISLDMDGRTEERAWTRTLIPEATFNAIDLATFAYLGVTGILIVLFYSNLQDPWYHLVMRLGMMGILYGLIRLCNGSRGVVKILRYWYPAFLFPYFYTETSSLNQMVFQGYWDSFFQNIDLSWFGTQPNIWLYERLDTLWFNESVHFCYFSYYFMSTVLAAVLYARKSNDFPRVFFVVSAGFYSCYLLYMFIPVAGPVELRHGRFEEQGLFIHIMNWIYANAEKPGAAFPSSHATIAVMTLLFARRSHRLTFWIFLPLVTGLLFSTIYGFYHYVVDVVVGVLLAVIFYVGYNRLYDLKFEEQFSTVFD